MQLLSVFAMKLAIFRIILIWVLSLKTETWRTLTWPELYSVVLDSFSRLRTLLTSDRTLNSDKTTYFCFILFLLSDKCLEQIQLSLSIAINVHTNKNETNCKINKNGEFENVYNLGRLFWKTSSSLPSAPSYFANHQLKF